MKKKVLATSLMTAVLSAAMLAGTVNAENAEPTPVTLVLYGEESARMTEFAENELHEKVMEEINVDLTIQYLPWSEYAAGKTELMLSSGEKFVTYTDTAFLAKCVAKGYYADLTDVYQENAKHLLEYCGGEEAFDTWKVDGRLYALPFGNKPNAGENYLILAREDLMEEVGVTDLKTLEDVENLWNLVHEKYPDMLGFSRGGINPMIFNGVLDSDRNIFRMNAFVATDGNQPDSSEVWSYYESDEYRQSCEIARKWYEMGMIPSYVLSNGSQCDSEFYNGNALFTIGANYRIFEYGDILQKIDPNIYFKNFYLGDKEEKPLMSRGTYSTAFAVSANVEGEELVGYVKLIDLLQSSQEWVDFILYGVEGKDYTVNEDGTFNVTNTDVLVDTWLPDNINFTRYQPWVKEEQIETYTNWNEGSIPQKDIGFAFDLTPVSTEYAQLQAVEQEYFNPMTAGVVSFEEKGEEAIKKLKDAGIDRLVEEYQRQFDEFMKSNK
ncbi:MAG: ABC transporter substrate-binding protein [Marvinbryantia sp.]|jgi:putative aldouronate transport system substrate-binding protein